MKKKNIMLALILLIVGTAYALPQYAFEKTYYSDATKTQVVGDASYFCGNTIYQSGQVTAYYDEIDLGSCTGLPHPDPEFPLGKIKWGPW